ncbi:hypothetical protein CBR_g29321 [Chara braunii]|uniref:FHA domain-containing protein n=1 Tax=Chara braunii TaxID=69332 RepID=A0A388JWD4_CHABU|nr:hypothetical protein CBR_g29321 [Chara braunii]|eukprot:GBG62121.1 hypothetical protein CBR_g29321 [Chara braunii]
MFWILKAEAAAGDPGQELLSGSLGKLGPYILKAPGTYKVGRKDSDISINDRAVSRHHADIVVGPLGPLPDPAVSGTAVDRTKAMADWISIWRPSIKVKDVSKFGTLVCDRSGTKKQSETPDRSAELNEGDLVVFLHCKVHFRLECKPIIACVSSVVESERRRQLTHNLKSAGAGVVAQWSEFATHLVVDDGAHCNDEIVAAVSAGRHLVHSRWAEALALRQTVRDVLPPEEE